MADEQVSIKAVAVAAVLLTQVGNIAYDRVTQPYVTEGAYATKESVRAISSDMVALRAKFDDLYSKLDNRVDSLEFNLWEAKRDCIDVSKDCKRLEKRIENSNH